MAKVKKKILKSKRVEVPVTDSKSEPASVPKSSGKKKKKKQAPEAVVKDVVKASVADIKSTPAVKKKVRKKLITAVAEDELKKRALAEFETPSFAKESDDDDDVAPLKKKPKKSSKASPKVRDEKEPLNLGGSDDESENSFFGGDAEDAEEWKKVSAKPNVGNMEKILDDFKVWVGDLPWIVKQDVVQADFEECGEILRFDMPKNKAGLPDGVAFIYYKDKGGMDKALEFDGTDYHGKMIKVKHSKPQLREAKDPTEIKPRTDDALTVFVGGLSFDSDKDSLTKDFGACGEVDAIRMLRRQEDGRFKGIAFIAFKTQAGVQKALKWDGQQYGGRSLSVKIPDAPGSGKGGKAGKGDAKGKGGKDKSKGEGKGGASATANTVFVGSLSPATELDTLRKDFEECGEIDTIRMVKKADGFFTGAAFIVYKEEAAVQEALKWSGESYNGRTIKVDKAQAGSKDRAAQDKGEGKGKGEKGKERKYL